jgi:hypothetical protein
MAVKKLLEVQLACVSRMAGCQMGLSDTGYGSGIGCGLWGNADLIPNILSSEPAKGCSVQLPIIKGPCFGSRGIPGIIQ